MDITHQPRKGPPKRSGWENQKETTDEYRNGWDRIFKKGSGECVTPVKAPRKSKGRRSA
jgi:hypothetical protein